MIRVRRVDSGFPLVRAYQIELAATHTAPASEHIERIRRGAAVRRLERVVGTGDAWSFIEAADRAWDEGNRSWAVEYQSRR
jgi:signal recognition particle GTPase